MSLAQVWSGVFFGISFVNYVSIFVNDLEMKILWKMVNTVHHYCACFLQCPGGAFTPNVRTTKEFPDDVVTFIRNHPLMFNPIYPINKRPLIIRIGADYKYTKIAVDRVNAADGRYHVLFLGTGKRNLAAFFFLCCNGICNQLWVLQFTAFRNISLNVCNLQKYYRKLWIMFSLLSMHFSICYRHQLCARDTIYWS